MPEAAGRGEGETADGKVTGSWIAAAFVTKPIDFHFGCWTVGDDKMDNRSVDLRCLHRRLVLFY